MGIEFARRTGTTLSILAGLGHYPHLQRPQQAVDEVRASFDGW
jgi:pimeloyl-ACP methyl ester carboxylesterase